MNILYNLNVLHGVFYSENFVVVVVAAWLSEILGISWQTLIFDND